MTYELRKLASTIGRAGMWNASPGAMYGEAFVGPDVALVMSEAAKRLDEAIAMLEELGEEACEGFCDGSPDCAQFPKEDCQGCRAKHLAWKLKIPA